MTSGDAARRRIESASVSRSMLAVLPDRVVATGFVDLPRDSRLLECHRRPVMDSRSPGKQTKHDAPGVVRVGGPEDRHTVTLEGGRGRANATVIGECFEPASNVLIKAGVKFGHQGALSFRERYSCI